MLGIPEALNRILSNARQLESEQIALDDALGRICGEQILAQEAHPAFDNSAMDGYAVRAQDLAGASDKNPVELPISGEIPAGHPLGDALQPGSAARIYTGAPIPMGCDAVVMQEDTQRHDNIVSVMQPPKLGANIRRAGEDIATGDTLLNPGQRVRAGEIAVLASQGVAKLNVTRQPRIVVVPTGSEVVEIDANVPQGSIRNSNSHMVAAQLREWGAAPTCLAPVPDERGKLKRALERAAEEHDLVVTIGGVSVGHYDLVRDVMQELGAMDFWKIALKPGKPLAFGKIQTTLCMGLPGNPISSYVCAHLFLRPLIKKMLGTSTATGERRARMAVAVKRNATRTEFLRGALQASDEGVSFVPHTKQGSGQLSSLLGINALCEVPPGEGELAKGEMVTTYDI